MIERLDIENFRGLDKLTIEGLARVNVFVGANNVGKTSVLEAIYLLNEAGVTTTVGQVLARRGYQGGGQAPDWLDLIRTSGSSGAVTLEGSDGKGSWKTEFNQGESGPVLRLGGWGGASFDHPNAAQRQNRPKTVWFSLADMPDVKLAKEVTRWHEEKREKEPVAWLQPIEPRLTEISQGQRHNQPEVFIDVGLPRRIRLTQAGHGLRYALALFAALDGAQDSVVLVDEIEVGLHHDALKSVWQAINAFSRANRLQLFVTTHSYDCLKAVHDAMQSDADELAVFRLQRGDSGHVVPVAIKGEGLEGVLSMDLEVR